jgi:hypothetical protein
MTLAVLLGVAALFIGILGIWMTARGFRSLRATRLIAEEAAKAASISIIAAAASRAVGEVTGLTDDAAVNPATPRAHKRRFRFSLRLKQPSGFELVVGAGQHHPPTDVPSWALRLMGSDDAQRYTWEWGAHLHQLVEEGELRQARRDRRRLALGAITMAIALRVRQVLRKAR